MGKIIGLMNEKGGVGKSALTFSCAWYLMESGKKVLIVDMDGQQANITYLSGLQTDTATKTMEDVLMKDVDPNECCVNVASSENGLLDMLPATIQMAGLPSTAKISKMKKAMKSLASKYDYVFLDVNPSPDWRHALVLSVLDKVYIVMLLDVLSLEANKGIFESIEEVQDSTNSNLEIGGIILNQADLRTKLANAVLEKVKEMADFYHTEVCEWAFVRKAVAFAESVAAHQGITAYAAKSGVADDIRKLTEIIAR